MVSGVTRTEDAVELAHLGVSALGFHLEPGGPRSVGAEALARLAELLPPWLTRVGLARAGTGTELLEGARRAGLHLLEVSDPEGPRALEGLPLPAYPSLALTPALDPARARGYGPGWILLRVPDEGVSLAELPACWTAAEECSRYARVLLGGPLGPGEVELALRRVRPAGLALGAGVEREPGVIDLSRVEAVIELAGRLRR
jgi:phosphoribosylanthranilate isomerase